MSLVTKLAEEFSADARLEGERLRAAGDIQILHHEPGWIEARVRGTRPYDVTLAREKGAVRYACECPYYTNTLDPCRHVWGTLLASSEKGYLDEWDTSRRLDFLPEDEDPEADLGSGNGYPHGNGAGGLRLAGQPRNRRARKARAPGWKQTFAALRSSMTTGEAQTAAWPPGREILYVVDVPRTLEGRGLVVEVAYREPKKDGQWSKPKRQAIRAEEVSTLPNPDDREIVSMLTGARSARDQFGYYYSSYDSLSTSSYRLPQAMLLPLTRRMCATGRCRLRRDPDAADLPILAWDEAGAWEFFLSVRKDEGADHFTVTGELRRGEQRMSLADPVMLCAGGLVFTEDRVAPLDDADAFAWISLLRENREITVPDSDGNELLQQLLGLPRVPRLDLPEELRFERVVVAPQARLKVRKPRQQYAYNDRLEGELSFDYAGTVVSAEDTGTGVYQPERNRMIVRDAEAERAAAARLRGLGFRKYGSYYGEPSNYQLAPNQLPVVIRKLTQENWYVEADGQLYRQPGKVKIDVSSGIDWFELHGGAEFGDQKVGLPELLRALHRGEKTVRLGDGTFGVLPEEWLKKYGLLAGMGKTEDDHVRFGRSQVGVLDALLASQPDATCDATFDRVRQQLRDFQGVAPLEAPASFVGTLRPYQREGLGWIDFLRQFGFGGCLADDMGLGKTVQVLALLEGRRAMRAAGAEGGPRGPSLVVAPRSLIFNWKDEASRFAPQLKVLDHTGIGRARSAEPFAEYDLILTTYGTLRNDATFFKDIAFDYLILDEAQAIKNSGSESAKAVRLMQGGQRLALSGTPVQNHLGELWSLFEFLNPGMLGSARAFQAAAGSSRVVDDATRDLLSRALRPFILRRTKGQVAKDLPQRLEQTIHCELDAAQRKMYNDLREHYRQSLLARVATEGINKAKIQILEALLRLRQVACHPGLVDKSKTNLGSAKLDALLPQIAEVMEEGHKVLVFSQFTSFLSIVRERLDKEKVKYEYLDGRTRDRASVVDRFQNDESCRLFLISLKAGGLGLNLTAAEYVFLLDPWWNPAVEAQAIDRAHRIGQTRQVFAYRLIAKDTVEEKVLQLQQSKRDLADAIISADNSLIGKLGREDLELLLS